jgi:hypothetical protein
MRVGPDHATFDIVIAELPELVRVNCCAEYPVASGAPKTITGSNESCPRFDKFPLFPEPCPEPLSGTFTVQPCEVVKPRDPVKLEAVSGLNVMLTVSVPPGGRVTGSEGVERENSGVESEIVTMEKVRAVLLLSVTIVD